MAFLTSVSSVVAVMASLPIFGPLDFAPPPREAPGSHERPTASRLPSAGAIETAKRYAGEREGLTSFAVIDSRGHLHGYDLNRLYPAASSVKALVLAAELRRLARAGEPVDPATDSLLSAMIRFSDNDAADSIYARVGDAGVLEAARRAQMTSFTIAGHWGTAQVSAADMARFFATLDRVLPQRHRRYGQQLLGSVIHSQSWGIPVAAGEHWGARTKGGWLPERALVHQAAELRERGGPRELSIAVLTDEQPSFGYGVQTVQGLAERLLARGQRP